MNIYFFSGSEFISYNGQGRNGTFDRVHWKCIVRTPAGGQRSKAAGVACLDSTNWVRVPRWLWWWTGCSNESLEVVLLTVWSDWPPCFTAASAARFYRFNRRQVKQSERVTYTTGGASVWKFPSVPLEFKGALPRCPLTWATGAVHLSEMKIELPTCDFRFNSEGIFKWRSKSMSKNATDAIDNDLKSVKFYSRQN
jgi:hypothetical protein